MFVLFVNFKSKMFNSFSSVLLMFCMSVALSSATCGQVFENKITEDDKKQIINTHNLLRTQIAQGKIPGQPKAKNMCLLKWDPALAAAAQKIANSCEFKHVRVNDKRFYVGQNLAWTGSTNKKPGAEWRQAIKQWFDEYKKFSYPNRSSGVTGHYTQVVWAETKYVGCGYIAYKVSNYYEKLYVCNYGPGGNIVGYPPYLV